jgi:hypothetical protein
MQAKMQPSDRSCAPTENPLPLKERSQTIQRLTPINATKSSGLHFQTNKSR